MNYTLHQLQVFLKITQTLSITKAAEELHLSQPAVSIQLKNFQDQFEIPLTEVIGRKLYVTDFGKEVGEAAEKIINEVYAINYKTLAYKGQLTGRLKITSVSTGKYVMPYLLRDFINNHNGIELVMDVTNKSRVVKSLERNEVDFSLISVMPDKQELNSEPLMENRLFLVSGTHQKEPIQIRDKRMFEDLPMIFREEGSGTRYVMEQFFKTHQLNVQKKLELASNEAVKQAVLAGLGFSVMPLIGIKNELRLGQLRIIPVDGFPVSTTWQLVWLKKKKLSPVAKAYLEYIRMQKNLIIDNDFGWTRDY